MKAPLHLPGTLPDAADQRRRAAAHRLWRRRLLRGASIVLAVLLAWAAVALLDQAEGDLRQVRAPSLDAKSTQLA